MPTYEYRCQECGHQFDVFQSMKDERLTDCPLEECSGLVKRLIGTGAGIIFKGSGFYETDYRSESYKKAASADTAPAESGSGKSGSDKSGGGESGGGKADSGKSEASKTPAKPAAAKAGD